MPSEQENAGTPHVLSLCDKSGNAVRPWARNGYIAWCVDLDAEPRVETVGRGAIVYHQADVREWEPPAVEFQAGFAWPPCTDLAYSGARWFDSKGWERFGDALALAGRCRDLLEEHVDGPWLIENPASRLQDFFGEPSHTFHPYEYNGYTGRNERYTKETWLWTSDEFRMPERDGVPRSQADDRVHTMAPGEERSDKRAETPTGFARAVYLAHAQPGEYARPGEAREQAKLVTDGGRDGLSAGASHDCPECDWGHLIRMEHRRGGHYWVCSYVPCSRVVKTYEPEAPSHA